MPADTTTAPISPPTSACDDDEGMPFHQVTRFQVMAPSSPHSRMVSAAVGAMPSSRTKLPMVLATAVPPSSGPRNSKKPTTSTACAGVMACEAITVATMLAAS